MEVELEAKSVSKLVTAVKKRDTNGTADVEVGMVAPWKQGLETGIAFKVKQLLSKKKRQQFKMLSKYEVEAGKKVIAVTAIKIKRWMLKNAGCCQR